MPIPARPLTRTQMNRQKTRDTLRHQGLAPNKRLGQNFLVQPSIAQRIVDLAGLSPQDQVVEIGVGLGALTRPLAEACAEVIGLETDSGIIRMHQEQNDLPPNVRLVHADALKVDFATLLPGERLKIVANLPYSISTPFLFRLIDHAEMMDFAVLMLQKEVAQRLVAQPGGKDYGAPSVLLASCADVEMLLFVPPEAFHPQPKVDSQVVRIRFHTEQANTNTKDMDRRMLGRVVHAAFGQRRKTLLNGLSAGNFTSNKTELAERIRAVGIDPSARAETLTPAQFICLSKELASVLNRRE